MFGKKKETKQPVKQNSNKTKPVLTKLLLCLVNENSRYEAALKMLALEIKNADERSLLVGTNRLKDILICSGYQVDDEDVPTYEELVRECLSNENET